MLDLEKARASVPIESSTPDRNAVFGIRRDILAPAILVIAVSVLRLPFILWPHEMNPDESQMLSQAMKYLVDPVPWRSVDGTSGGPLNSYLISIFLLWGIKPGYIFVHLLADVLVCLQLVVAYRTLLRITSSAGAMWGVLPMMLCLGFTSSFDFLHYSSELLPALLLAIGFHLFAVLVRCGGEGRSSRRSILVFLCGLALGMAPWCKLQALPVAGVLALAVSARIWTERHRGKLALSQFVQLWLGVLLPGAAILGVVAQGGALRDFWNSYVLGNLAYAGAFGVVRIAGTMMWALWLPQVRLLTLVLLLALPILLSLRRKRLVPELTSDEVWLSGSAACYFFAALFVVCRPAIQFPHYMIFLLYPMTFLAVFLASRSWPALAAKHEGQLRGAMHVLAGCVAVVSIFYMAARIHASRNIRQPPPNASERIAAEIQKMEADRPIKSLSIWGWEPGVYVLTGIPPATRDSIGHFVISLGLSRPYFRQRFVGDLRRANPDLFVDTVAKGAFLWYWHEYNGYETDPELKSYIDEHYVLVKELTLQDGAKPVRFFERR